MKKISTPEYSMRDVIPDYINFILVLVLGFIFKQKGTDVTYFFLMQIALLVICFILSVIFYSFKKTITSKKQKTSNASLSQSFSYYYCCVIFGGVGICFFIGLLAILYDLLTSNFAICLACFPSVLFAYRKIFQKSEQGSSEFSYIFLKGFIIIGCAPLLLVVPEIFTTIGLNDSISFFICCSLLCFPYKKTFNLLVSPKSRKKVCNFYSTPIKLFGTAFTTFSLVFLFLACYGYWRSNFEDESVRGLIFFSFPFIIVGIIILCKGK